MSGKHAARIGEMTAIRSIWARDAVGWGRETRTGLALQQLAWLRLASSKPPLHTRTVKNEVRNPWCTMCVRLYAGAEQHRSLLQTSNGTTPAPVEAGEMVAHAGAPDLAAACALDPVSGLSLQMSGHLPLGHLPT